MRAMVDLVVEEQNKMGENLLFMARRPIRPPPGLAPLLLLPLDDADIHLPYWNQPVVFFEELVACPRGLDSELLGPAVRQRFGRFATISSVSVIIARIEKVKEEGKRGERPLRRCMVVAVMLLPTIGDNHGVVREGDVDWLKRIELLVLEVGEMSNRPLEPLAETKVISLQSVVEHEGPQNSQPSAFIEDTLGMLEILHQCQV